MKNSIMIFSYLATIVVCLAAGFTYGFFKGVITVRDQKNREMCISPEDLKKLQEEEK